MTQKNNEENYGTNYRNKYQLMPQRTMRTIIVQNYRMTNLMYVNAPQSTQKHALYVVMIIRVKAGI
jgi:hypothetical protein